MCVSACECVFVCERECVNVCCMFECVLCVFECAPACECVFVCALECLFARVCLCVYLGVCVCVCV